MDTPVSDIIICEPPSINNSVKLKTKQGNLDKTSCLFLPHNTSRSDTSYEQKLDPALVKEDPPDLSFGDAPPVDPLAIEETSMIISEDLRFKNEVPRTTTTCVHTCETALSNKCLSQSYYIFLVIILYYVLCITSLLCLRL